MAKKRKEEIGKGLKAIFSSMDNDVADDKKAVVGKKLSSTVAKIPLTSIEVNPFQPRKDFDQESLDTLAESIETHGLIQPITVRKLDNKKYQLISGERRLRASKMAGLKEIPAYIRTANDQEMLEMALVENIHRDDLNAIEISITYQRLMDECDLTQEGLSKRIGKNRSTITNYLRLLKLPPEIQVGIKNKDLSMGHARALLGAPDLGLQLSLYKDIIANQLSVRRVEELIRQFQKADKKEAPAASKLSKDYRKVQDNLSSYLGTKVALKVGKKGNGQITINFANDEDLNRILDLLED
ncbi:MAG: ParB/RepB/Spo0J family partition protein [Bacteroidota bacterium]